MRKSILIASLILFSGHAAFAAGDAPPGEAREEIRTNDIKPNEKASDPVKAEAAKPETAKPEAAKPEALKPARKRVVRNRESDEHKARRIAAKYGVTW